MEPRVFTFLRAESTERVPVEELVTGMMLAQAGGTITHQQEYLTPVVLYAVGCFYHLHIQYMLLYIEILIHSVSHRETEWRGVCAHLLPKAVFCQTKCVPLYYLFKVKFVLPLWCHSMNYFIFLFVWLLSQWDIWITLGLCPQEGVFLSACCSYFS